MQPSCPYVAVAIPTMNATGRWDSFHKGLAAQTLPIVEVLVIDSSSTDGTAELAKAAGYSVISIARADFNHGSTRQIAVERLSAAELIVFLTQDAVLVDPDALTKLVAPFADPQVGAVYGRQLPHRGADPVEAHARIFNYPAEGHVNCWEARGQLGIKAAFLSNSFSAYRRSALESIGGFMHTISAEDSLAAGQLLMANWKTVYVAEATVEHSHRYTIGEEFSRYFDTGVYHAREAWLLKAYGTVQGEGRRFVVSEILYLLRHAPHRIPGALLRTAVKALGYKLGRLEARLPPRWRRQFSMHKNFWDDEAMKRRSGRWT